MQRLEVSGVVRPIYGSLGVKGNPYDPPGMRGVKITKALLYYLRCLGI